MALRIRDLIKRFEIIIGRYIRLGTVVTTAVVLKPCTVGIFKRYIIFPYNYDNMSKQSCDPINLVAVPNIQHRKQYNRFVTTQRMHKRYRTEFCVCIQGDFFYRYPAIFSWEIKEIVSYYDHLKLVFKYCWFSK